MRKFFNQISRPGIILDYRGPIDHGQIEQLLDKLKKSNEFTDLDTTTGKRVYALVVECLENIAKHSDVQNPDNKKIQPHISVRMVNEQVIISTGNGVNNSKIDDLSKRLCHINELDEPSLIRYYENKINKDVVPQKKSAGLGFIIMRLKSGNKIEFILTDAGNEMTYLEIKIVINKYSMRKLIIEKTSNSPKVSFDPDLNFFEISGESRPPDVSAFYAEILKWFDDYSSYLGWSEESKKPVSLNLDFEYFNSSSAKYLLDLCKKIASARLNGMDVSVKWHYEEDDVDMFEAGKEMSRIAKIPFEYVQKNK